MLGDKLHKTQRITTLNIFQRKRSPKIRTDKVPRQKRVWQSESKEIVQNDLMLYFYPNNF